jgi:hypothetical protein
MASQENSRRSFLKQTMLLSAAATLPTIITKAGKPAPSDKVNLAMPFLPVRCREIY